MNADKFVDFHILDFFEVLRSHVFVQLYYEGVVAVRTLANVDLTQINDQVLKSRWSKLISAFSYVALLNFSSRLPAGWYPRLQVRPKEKFAAYSARVCPAICTLQESEFRQLVLQVLKVRGFAVSPW